MADYPEEFEEHIEDDFERMELSGRYHEETSQSDPGSHEMAILSRRMAVMAMNMKPKHRSILAYYFRGHSKTDIAKRLHTSYPTIATVLHSDVGLRYMNLLFKVDELKSGPTLEARRAMLWRIAKRTELSKPTTAMKAIDILNKQAKDYAPPIDDIEIDDKLVVRTLNFIVQQNITSSKEVQTNVIEGEFTPITIEVPDQ
jgi:hypothetical protein